MAEHSVRACLITNPRSGRGGIDLSEALAVLQAQGWTLTVQQKLYGGHATELARAAVKDGYDVVVGCGGDGTLSEIVDGLTGTDVALGALPGGTVNLWARELGISRRLRVAALQLAGAERRRIDVGRLTINGKHRRHFLLMAGLGIDGAVMGRVSKPLKNRIGPLAVGLAAIGSAPSLRLVSVRADLDGMHWQGRIAEVIVGNTRQYGGFASITPNAYIDDGMLDVCVITAASPLSVGRQLSSLLFHGRPDPRTAEFYRVASVSIHAPVALPLQVDGGAERVKRLKPSADGLVYTFSSIAQGVSVLVPRTYDGTLFMRDRLLEPLTRLSAEPRVSDERGDHAADDAEQDDRRQMRILAIGASTFTAVRLDNGRVWTVQVGDGTVLKNGSGDDQSLATALPELRVGSIVRVRGKKDRVARTIAAKSVRLLAAP